MMTHSTKPVTALMSQELSRARVLGKFIVLLITKSTLVERGRRKRRDTQINLHGLSRRWSGVAPEANLYSYKIFTQDVSSAILTKF